MEKKWCLITGGSKGIGYEFAKLFARDKYNLILIARSADLLNKVKKELEENENIEVVVIPLDLLEPDSLYILQREIKRRNIEIDVLVNNAGFGGYGKFVNDDIERDIDMIHLNIEAITRITYEFLPEMLRRGRGKILNVASIAAFMPGVLSAVYYAAKSYILNWSLAIEEEIKGSGVSLSVLCPGPVKTDFMRTSGMGEAKIMRWLATSPINVAKTGYNGLMREKPLIIPGTFNRLLVLGSRIMPVKLVMKVTKFLMQP